MTTNIKTPQWGQIGLLLSAIVVFGVITGFRDAPKKPNVVFILADDLGWGDLSHHGQKHFQTPNIDALFREGAELTRHYAGNTVCSPSRASLMTGVHNGHATVRKNESSGLGEGQAPIHDTCFTIAELFKQAGYQTGAFGKWGIGFIGTEGDPLNQGFDEFYGYNCQSIAHRYYPPHLWHGKNNKSEKVEFPENKGKNPSTYAQDIIQEKALDFITKNKKNPFFIYVPYLLPHAELIAPDDSILQRFLGKFEEPKPFKNGNDYGSANFSTAGYASQTHPRAHFAAMVTRLDHYVGQLVKKLKAEGLYENTIIIFSSDNGPHKEAGADPNFFKSSGPYSGLKRDLTDGGIRMPTAVVWPNNIKRGAKVSQLSAFYDYLPTFAQLLKQRIPTHTDGVSILPQLLGKKEVQRAPLYWEFYENNGCQALLDGQYKLIRTNVLAGEEKLALYNLRQDPSEQNNLASKEPERTARMLAQLKAQHQPLLPNCVMP